jgi:similar to stage IV sporulation protein
MARLDEFIFGYYRGRVERGDVPKLTNCILRLGICSEISPNGDFKVRAKDKPHLVKHARGKISFSFSDMLGVYGFLIKHRKRYGLFAAFFLLTVIFMLTRALVWDVRIDGNLTLPEQAVAEVLSDHGVRVGIPWRKIDKNYVEATILSEHPEIAWVSVNRRGTVAYVEVIESENVGKDEKVSPICSNIVAACDGVIEEITVKSGEAMVKVGDVVRKGDILISGVLENETGVRFCRAVGTVIAHSSTDIDAEIPRQVTQKTEVSHRIAEVRILLFNFSINIFKNYGNCENTCDIIEENRDFALFDKYKLPFSLKKTYIIEYSELDKVLTDEEMIAAAKRMLDAKIYSSMKNADVIKLRTEGGFFGDAYRLVTKVVYSADIGKESAIEIN